MHNLSDHAVEALPIKGETSLLPDVVDSARSAVVLPTVLVNSPGDARKRPAIVLPQFRAPVRWGINE